jgi:hypothetical protein
MAAASAVSTVCRWSTRSKSALPSTGNDSDTTDEVWNRGCCTGASGQNFTSLGRDICPSSNNTVYMGQKIAPSIGGLDFGEEDQCAGTGELPTSQTRCNKSVGQLTGQAKGQQECCDLYPRNPEVGRKRGIICTALMVQHRSL